jgi:hypothetical protein
MPTEDDDIAYFRRRIEACTAQALRAESLSARRAHEALAQLYREKLVALGADPGLDGEQAAAKSGGIRPAADKPPARSGPREF